MIEMQPTLEASKEEEEDKRSGSDSQSSPPREYPDDVFEGDYHEIVIQSESPEGSLDHKMERHREYKARINSSDEDEFTEMDIECTDHFDWAFKQHRKVSELSEGSGGNYRR